MSKKIQCNATLVESTSSDVIISKGPSEIENSNSLNELCGSGSLNIVGSVSVSETKSSLGNSFLNHSLQSNNELKESLINKFSTLNINDNNNNNLGYDFFSLKEIKENKNWNNKIFQIRKIKKDKNSFTRSIIFCFLEKLVLNKDINTLKEFIFKLNEIAELEKKEIIINTFIIILEYLQQENKRIDAYKTLLKAFFYFNEFDFGLNFFVRKLLFNYLSKSQNKSLNDKKMSGSFNLNKSGNAELLEKLNKDILNMEYEIPYNEIYSKVIPYIFKYDLDMILFNSDKKGNINEQLKEIRYKYKENNNSCINIIYFEKEKNFYIYYPNDDFYQKFNTYLNVINNKKCKKCGSIFNSQNKKNNLCSKCSIKEINEYIYHSYLNFLENNKIKDLTKNNIKKIKNYISNHSIGSDFIKDYKSLEEIISENGFDIKQLIKETIEKLCIVCHQNITINKNNFFTLPCKCKFCSWVCLEKYIKSIKEKNEEVLFNDEKVILPMSECFCGYQYKLKDFNELKISLEKINKKDYWYIIDETIDNNLFWKCISCRKNFDKKNKFINLYLKDQKNHLLCENCCKGKKIDINDGNNNKELIEIFCEFCLVKHYIKSWDIAGESNCIIL